MLIDIIVLVVLLISAAIAFLRGFIREVLTIAGVVGGLAGAYLLGPYLLPIMNSALGVTEGEEPKKLFDILPYDVIAVALAYGIVFIVIVIILSIISHYLAETAKKFGLGAVDRTLGFIFGLLRGILLLGLLFLPVHLFIDDETKEEYLKDTQSRVYLEKTADAIANLIPQGMTDKIEENTEEVSEALGARKKLEEIDLLKEHQKRLREENESGDTPQDQNQGQGYDNEFRDNMDRLIKETTSEE